jgi:hypothetical protein
VYTESPDKRSNREEDFKPPKNTKEGYQYPDTIQSVGIVVSAVSGH